MCCMTLIAIPGGFQKKYSAKFFLIVSYMAEYKVRQYKPRSSDKKIVIDTKVKFYDPIQSANDYKPLGKKTQGTKDQKVRTYDKTKEYDSYSEYVPPWSRGKEKGKRTVKPADPQPEQKKQSVVKPSPKVTVAALPKDPSLSSLGTVKRMLSLFTSVAGQQQNRPPDF